MLKVIHSIIIIEIIAMSQEGCANKKMNSQSKKQYQISENPKIKSVLSEQTEYLQENINQKFYRTINRRFKDQIVIKHGYQAFSIGMEEEDLVRFCMNLLQYDAKFPLKVVFHENSSQGYKDIWIQTQFLQCCVTLQGNNENKNDIFENKVYNFFKYNAIPSLCKFKESKMNWEYMVSGDYTDDKVIQQFRQIIIKRFNLEFKELCRSCKN